MSTGKGSFSYGELAGFIPFFNDLRITAESLGAELYIVGGAARDILLRRPIKDADAVPFGCGYENFAKALARRINARPAAFKDNIRLMKKNAVIDVSKPRGSVIEEDLALRDFTINNLAISLRGELIGDAGDIKNRIIRAVYPAAFDDDPVRILRAFRFVSSLGFEMEEKTKKLAGMKKYLLKTAARERILEELKKTFSGPHLGKSLELLKNENILSSLKGKASLDWEAPLRIQKISGLSEGVFPVMLAAFAGSDEGSGNFIENLSLSSKETKTLNYLLKAEKGVLLLDPADGKAAKRLAWKHYGRLKELLIYIEGKYPQTVAQTTALEKAAQTLEPEKAAAVSGELLKSMGFAPSPIFKKIIEETAEALVLGFIGEKEVKEYIIKTYGGPS